MSDKVSGFRKNTSKFMSQILYIRRNEPFQTASGEMATERKASGSAKQPQKQVTVHSFKKVSGFLMVPHIGATKTSA